MIVLRHIEGRRSERVAWLREELVVPYHAYLDTFPNVKRFLQQVAAHPPYQRAMQSTTPAGPPAF